MNSSTSSSDARAGRGFIGVFLGVGAAAATLVLAALMLLDPFGTGRLTPFDRPIVFETGPRTANAARLRNPEFDAAIIGNSTMQSLSPERLNAPTGRRFLQLTIPGTGPYEQTILARRLVDVRGSALRVLVLGLDVSWCEPRRQTETLHPFPDWLYAPSLFEYFAGLFRMSNVEALPRRIALLAGRERPARPDGFWDYERLAGAGTQAPRADIPAREVARVRNGPQSAALKLGEILQFLPATTVPVLVMPPVFVTGAPRAADAIAAQAECKAELRAAVAARRADAAFLDFWIDDPMNRDPTTFIDHVHYREAQVRRIEAEIARALSRNR